MNAKISKILLVSGILFSFTACDKVEESLVAKEWTVAMSADKETTPPAGRTETGTAGIKLMKDNSLIYNFTVNNLKSGDALTMAHLHPGAQGVNGAPVLTLTTSITGTGAYGTITNLRQSLVDSLKGNTAKIYINVHSQQVPAGLVRGQLQ